ncbi:SMI1/KNR4 family protein [Exiguobacterium sp. RIT341]|uniref:SMI1/KNR4 family protein n=1 Tax=Exiguobacterium sp. RIT341 TaxID=1470592 RepID=UPI00044EBAD8|nr:SMI1/KNR4 family protein [Exiguobacterium sp. RIT341]EZP61532.1 SMI1 / KNR4 family protein [Exiguobacterium sp. RIT341]
MKPAIRHINPSSKRPGVSLVEIKRAEKSLGVKFPMDYSSLIQESNGAIFHDWILYSIPTESSHSEVKNIIHHYANRPDDLPEDMICFGEHLDGRRLCYRIRRRFLQELVFTWHPKKGLEKYCASSLDAWVESEMLRDRANKKISIGTFNVSSRMLVTDSNEQDAASIILEQVKSGVWTASVTYASDGTIRLLTVYEGNDQPTGKWTRSHEIAIDSGYVLIIDEIAFRKQELSEELFFGQEDVHLLRAGIMTESGYGDGIYDLKVKKNRDKQIIGVRINFME